MHKPRFQTLASLIIITAVLSLFLPALLNPFLVLHPTFSPFSDTMVIHWPKAHLMTQSWQQGHGLPHWTPYILSGMPLAANQLAMLAYPPAWLFLFLPIEPTFNLLFIFHLLLGGFGIYFLLREYQYSSGAALLGALTFALNGKWLAHAAGGHVSMVGAIGWMPWTLWGVVMLTRGARSARPAIPWLPGLIIAVSLGMQIVTHTLPVIYSVYLIAAVVGWHSILSLKQAHEQAEPWGDWLRSTFWLLFYLAVAMAMGGLLGAGQLLPLLELVEFSNRSLSPAQAAEYAVTPVQLVIGLLLPSAQGGHELVIYLGLIPLLIAPFGVSRRQPWSWFYASLLVFTILFALGPTTPVHSLFYHFAPGFRWVRTPARIFFVGAIAASVLVGFGIDRLLTTRWAINAQRWFTRLAVAIGATALILGVGLAVGFGQASRATIGLAILIPLGLVVILLCVRRRLSGRLTVLLLGLLLYIDLASFAGSMMKFVPLDEVLAQGQPATEFLAQQPGLFRIYSPSYSLPTQTAAAYNLQLADGVEPVHLSIYDEFMAQAGGYHETGFSVTIPHFGDQPLEVALKDVEPDLTLLGLLNVTYLAAAFPMDWPGLSLVTEIDGTYIYHNDYALPRAWVSHQTRRAEPDWLAQIEALPDLAAVAVVETDAPPITNPIPAGRVDIVTYAADVIELETTIDAPGWLVVSEIWYPGWQATVNGSIQPVERVDRLLRGVYLAQPGPYRVTLRYQPDSVRWGNWLAGITAVILGLVVIWRLGSHTKISGPDDSF